MGRAKAGMEMINNKKARRVAFENRRKGLEKKARELSTLCGVKVCFIIFGIIDDDKPIEPYIWPQNPEEIHSLIDCYKNASADDRRIRTTDVSFFYKDRMRKGEEDLAKLRRKNLEAKLRTWDERCDNLSMEEVRQLDGFLKAKLESMRARVDFMRGVQTYVAEVGGNLVTSSCDPQLSQVSLYMIQNRNSYTTKNNMMQLECLQRKPMVSSGGWDVPFQNSYNFNPRVMNLMNNGGSSSNNHAVSYVNSDQNIPAHFKMEPAAVEHLSSLDNNSNNVAGSPFYYYIPTMQPIPLYVQYPLQHSTVPTQMFGSRTEDHHGLTDFQLMNPK